MILTIEQKRALRRLQADKMLKQKELSEKLGLNPKTLGNILNSDLPQKVSRKTYEKVVQAICENF